MDNHMLQNNEVSREMNMQYEEPVLTGNALVPKENHSVSCTEDNLQVLPEPFELERSESVVKIEEKFIKKFEVWQSRFPWVQYRQENYLIKAYCITCE